MKRLLENIFFQVFGLSIEVRLKNSSTKIRFEINELVRIIKIRRLLQDAGVVLELQVLYFSRDRKCEVHAIFGHELNKIQQNKAEKGLSKLYFDELGFLTRNSLLGVPNGRNEIRAQIFRIRLEFLNNRKVQVISNFYIPRIGIPFG